MHHRRLCLRPQTRVKMTPTGSINQGVTSAAAWAPTLPTLPRQPPPRQLTRGVELGRHSCTSLALGPDLSRKQTACHHYGKGTSAPAECEEWSHPNVTLFSAPLASSATPYGLSLFFLLYLFSSLFRLKTHTLRATFSSLLYPQRHQVLLSFQIHIFINKYLVNRSNYTWMVCRAEAEGSSEGWRILRAVIMMSCLWQLRLV